MFTVNDEDLQTLEKQQLHADCYNIRTGFEAHDILWLACLQSHQPTHYASPAYEYLVGEALHQTEGLSAVNDAVQCVHPTLCFWKPHYTFPLFFVLHTGLSIYALFRSLSMTNFAPYS